MTEKVLVDLLKHARPLQPDRARNEVRVSELCRPFAQFTYGRLFEPAEDLRGELSREIGTAVHAAVHRSIRAAGSKRFDGWHFENGERLRMPLEVTRPDGTAETWILTGEPDFTAWGPTGDTLADPTDDVDGIAPDAWARYVVDLKVGSAYGRDRRDAAHALQLSLYAALLAYHDDPVDRAAILKVAVKDFRAGDPRVTTLEYDPQPDAALEYARETIARYIALRDADGLESEPLAGRRLPATFGCGTDEREKFGKYTDGTPKRCSSYCSYAHECDWRANAVAGVGVPSLVPGL